MNWLKAGLSCGVGFFIAIVVAILIEQCGGAIGGTISAAPTTILPTSYIFLTEANRTRAEQADTLFAAPIGIFATNLFFLSVWKILPAKLEKYMNNTILTFVVLVISIIIWFVVALFTSWVELLARDVGMTISLFSLIIMIICVIVGVILCWSLAPTPKGTHKVKWYIHILRGLTASICILISSYLSSSGFSLIAGPFSGFPAIFMTSIVSVSLSQGASVSTGAVGPMIIGGCAGGFYALICATIHKYTTFPAIASILLADVTVIVCWCWPVYYFVKWRRDVTAARKLTLPVVSKNEASPVAEKNEEVVVTEAPQQVEMEKTEESSFSVYYKNSYFCHSIKRKEIFSTNSFAFLLYSRNKFELKRT